MREFPPIDQKTEAAALQTLFFQDSEFEGKTCRLSIANYLAFLSLRGSEVQEEISNIRSALAQPTSAHLERDLTSLLRARNWRFHNIACVAIACGGASATLLAELWRCIRAGSWTSPQLSATAAYVDPEFQQRASLLIEDQATYFKSIVPLAALLTARMPELSLSEVARANLSEATALDRDNSGAIALNWHKSLVEAFGKA